VMRIFELTKSFPIEERYALKDQVRRSPRSVCANLAEAWRKRRYEAAFVSKLNDIALPRIRRYAVSPTHRYDSSPFAYFDIYTGLQPSLPRIFLDSSRNHP
jgi:hypothetical protein